MLAIPIDTPSSTTISEFYGKAPYFALLQPLNGHFSVVENEVRGEGPKSASFLSKLGVNSTIFYYMGEGVYKAFEKENMSVYTTSHNKCSIDEIFMKIENGGFKQLDSSNYSELLDSGESACSCGCKK